MTTRKKTEITSRHITGITWKQIWAVAVFLVSVTGYSVYRIAQAEAVSQQNNNLLHEMVADRKQIEIDRKDYERMQNIRLTNIELDQREAKIRLTVLEARLINKPPE